MERQARIPVSMAAAVAAALLLAFSPAASASGGPAPGMAGAKAAAASVISAAAGQGRAPGGMPGWNGARAGEPLLLRGNDGKPAEYIVPVVAGGATVATVGIDAADGGWHWYCRYDRGRFPVVSPERARTMASATLRGAGRTAQRLEAPQLRRAPDKDIYWYFHGPGGDVYVPAFEHGPPVLSGEVRGVLPGMGVASPCTPSMVENPAPTPTASASAPVGAGPGGNRSAYEIPGVPYHAQETDWWCGPASLQMVFDYFGPEVQQREIAGVADQGQSYGVYADDLARAAHFSGESASIQDPSLLGYTGRSTGYGMAYRYWETGGPLFARRYSDLKELVSQDLPVIVLTWYSADTRSGHFRVVKGYNDSLNALIVHDPWYTGYPSGPDVVFNQTEFVDNLWTYSHRWGMVCAPWGVDVFKPATVKAKQVFTVNADVSYRGPDPMGGQYYASAPVAALRAPGFQVVSPGVQQPAGGVSSSGSSGSVSWSVKAFRTGSTADISVQGQGFVSGSSRAYSSYTDRVGGSGDSAPVPGPTTREWGHDSVGVSAPAPRWFLAEGSTAGGFETWVLVQNPGSTSTAHVRLTYMTARGAVEGPATSIDPGSRATFNVADTVPGEWSVSTEVTSDVGVVAERAVYGKRRLLGTDSVGVPEASTVWYLAEGCTNGGFETWVLVQNPSDTPAEVSLEYMRPSGATRGPKANVPANSRVTFNVGDTVPGEWSVSTRVSSNVPVVAERAMYGNRRTFGHDSVGAAAPAGDWYLAEGCTNGGFETWVMVQNPSDTPARVELTYMTEYGETTGPAVVLPPNSRRTFNVADTVPSEWSVSTRVRSDAGVVVERAVYGNGRTWGHASVGAPATATTWYLAEGCTNTGFESWVLVQNPGDSPALVTITYMTPAGPVGGPSEVLGPRSRKTYNIADCVPGEWQVSTTVVGSRPVVAERAMYGDSEPVAP